MLSPAEAARTILQDVTRLPVERISLPEALLRVLANDVTSPIDLPGWDNSAMDGYAARSEDLRSKVGAVELRVIETIPAGAFPSKSLAPGECSRIFTGAPIPEGADTVIRQEDTTPLGDDRVRIDDVAGAKRNVRFRGEDIKRGTVVLLNGTALGPAHLGVLASMAQSEVYVYRQPKVAFLGSGDEIVDLDERDAILKGTKIASSNTYTLLAMIAQAGGEAINLGIAKDDPADITHRLANIFQADLLITTAGISVGEHDHMRTALDALHTDFKFWRILMRPGAPVGFGMIGATPWLGLPGNPVSTMVTFELFARPAIRKMLGHIKLFRASVPVRIAESFAVRAKLTHFLRAVITDDGDGTLSARLTGSQGSGILTSMAQANALLIVPAELADVTEGTTLAAIPLDGHVHVEQPPFE